MRHEDYKEMLAAEALSALDKEDARELELHLVSCADCRTELNEWHETAAMVALSSSSLEPSTLVRRRILETARAEGASTQARDQRTSFAPVASGSAVLPFEQPRRNVWTSMGSFGAIAAAITLIGISISLLVLWRQKRDAEAQLAQIATQMRQTNEELARQRAVVTLITSPGGRMTELAGTNAAPGAHAMIAYDKTGHAMLMAKGLPVAPAGKAYQLWFIMDNKKMPGKIFSIDADGNGVLQDQIPPEAIGAAVFAITMEPESGVQVPTGAVYLVSSS